MHFDILFFVTILKRVQYDVVVVILFTVVFMVTVFDVLDFVILTIV